MHNILILASSSQSRYNILKKSGVNFKKVNPTCDEEKIKKQIRKKNFNPYNFVRKVSFEKARSVSNLKKYKNNLVIGCDTIIYFNNKIFDKAKNMKEAFIKIKKLSGSEHKIISGLTICLNGKKIWQCQETSKIKIRDLSDKEIVNYLKSTGEQILSSVGCYQAESLGPIIIENIKGDFFNVLGIPLFKLLKKITKIK